MNPTKTLPIEVGTLQQLQEEHARYRTALEAIQAVYDGNTAHPAMRLLPTEQPITVGVLRTFIRDTLAR